MVDSTAAIQFTWIKRVFSDLNSDQIWKNKKERKRRWRRRRRCWWSFRGERRWRRQRLWRIKSLRGL